MGFEKPHYIFFLEVGALYVDKVMIYIHSPELTRVIFGVLQEPTKTLWWTELAWALSNIV